MPDDVGVGDAAVLAHDRRVGRPRVETAEQRLAGGVLQNPFRRADIAVAVGDLAAVDEEGVDHAVAGEPVVMAPGLELRIGPVAVEGAPESGRKFARDLEHEVVLAAHRREIAGEKGIDRKRCVHGRCLPGPSRKGPVACELVLGSIAAEIDGTAAGRKGATARRRFPVTSIRGDDNAKAEIGRGRTGNRRHRPRLHGHVGFLRPRRPRRERRHHPRRPRLRRDADRHRRFLRARATTRC